MRHWSFIIKNVTVKSYILPIDINLYKKFNFFISRYIGLVYKADHIAHYANTYRPITVRGNYLNFHTTGLHYTCDKEQFKAI